MPEERSITRPEAIGQSNGPAQDVLKNGPGNLFSCTGNAAAVGSVCIVPKPTASGTPEKLHRLDTHAFALSARHKGEDKNDQLGKAEFALTGEMRVR